MSEQQFMYTCPAEGCDYKQPFESVCAHYSGKQDDAHKGGYELAKSKLQSQEAESVDSSDSEGGESGDGSSADTKPEGGSVSFPSNPDGEDDGGGQESSESDGEIEACENCGGTDDLYTAEAVIRSPLSSQLDAAHVELIRQSDVVCLACGAVMDHE